MFVELDEATSGALFERHAIRGSRVDEGHTSPSGGQAFDILPRPKGRGFLLDGDVFMPGMNTMARGPYATLWHGLRAAKSRENVDRGVDVAIMMGSAIGACPFSDTQPCSTFRTATRNVSAA